jgi:hypothetical protein
MVDFTFGITLKLEKNKKPFAIGKVFYNNGQHIIEFTDPENANHMIKGLIPPYPESAQTPSEPQHQQPEQTKQKEDSRGSGGIG